MKRLVLVVTALGLTALFCGCAQVGPLFSSCQVYGSSRDAIVAHNQASVAEGQSKQVYFKELAKSYQSHNDDCSTSSRQQLKAPAFYQHGVLINRQNRDVTFSISGEKSLVRDVPAGKTLEVELPPGRYLVKISQQGSGYSHRRDWVTVDTERGDNDVNGQIYDFFIAASS